MKKLWILPIVMCVMLAVVGMTAYAEGSADCNGNQNGLTASDALYQSAENGDLCVEIPADWTWTDDNGMLYACANGDGDEPWLMAMKLDGSLNADEQIAAWKNEYMETYQNRLAFEPEVVTYDFGAGREIDSVRCMVSSVDGMRVSTLIRAVESVGDELYGYGCAYISSSCNEGEYEDEKTFFAFEHMMESMKTGS